MLNFITTLHLLTCLLLIILVLIQDPKGGTGSLFGAGSSNNLMSATGAASFVVRLTRWTAITFGVLCIILTWWLKHDGSVFSNMDMVEPAAVESVSKPTSTEGAPAAATTTPTTTPAANQPAAPTSTTAPQQPPATQKQDQK